MAREQSDQTQCGERPLALKPVKKHFFIKWLHAGFYQAAADIECHSCENFWTLKDIKRHMYATGGGGKVITDMKKPVGFMCYRRKRKDGDQKPVFRLTNLVILPEYRGQGLGACLLEDLQKKALRKECKITACVRERNNAMHKLLVSCGFETAGVWRDKYIDEHPTGTECEDGYLFRWIANR